MEELVFFEAEEITKIDCGDLLIGSLTGIEFFPNLTELRCDNNNLTSIPDISNMTKLTFFNCSNNKITQLPNINTLTLLEYLFVNNNQLSQLPNMDSLTKLRNLYCNDNLLTSLPDLTPFVELSSLQCQNNQITALPEISHLQKLKGIDCSNNKISVFPEINTMEELTSINCSSNQLTNFPEMPVSYKLELFDCSHNQITELPDLSKVLKLANIYCNNNLLKLLPPLPKKFPYGVKNLVCSNNKLKQLPLNISWLEKLDIRFNDLTYDECTVLQTEYPFIDEILINPQNEGSLDCMQKLSTVWINPNELLLSWMGGNNFQSELLYYNILKGTQIDNYNIEYNIIDQTKETSIIIPDVDPSKEHFFKVQPIHTGEVEGDSTSQTTYNGAYFEDYHLRFPHVAQNEQWWTGFIIVNPSYKSTNIELRAIDSSGAIIATSDVLTKVKGYDKHVGLVSEYFSQEILDQTSWVDLISSKRLIGFELFGQGFDNMSGIQISQNLLYNGTIPVSNHTNERYAAAALINATRWNADISFTGYSIDGEKLEMSSVEIREQRKLAATVKDIFGDNWSDDIHTVYWSSNRPMVGFEIWGDSIDWQYQNGISMRSYGSTRNYLPIIEPNCNILLQNTCDAENKFTVKVYDDNGELFTNKIYQLAPKETLVLTNHELTNDEFFGSLSIFSSGPANALVELRRERDDGTLAEAIPSQSKPGKELLFPHIASNDQWSTEIMVLNTSDIDKDITIKPFTSDGQGNDDTSITITIKGKGRLHSKIKDLFGDTDDIAYLRIYADEAVLIGHLIYYTNEGYGHVMGGGIVDAVK